MRWKKRRTEDRRGGEVKHEEGRGGGRTKRWRMLERKGRRERREENLLVKLLFSLLNKYQTSSVQLSLRGRFVSHTVVQVSTYFWP